MNDFLKIKNDAHSRRAFLQRMGAAGLGLAAISLLDGCGGGGGGGIGGGGGGGGSNFPLAAIPGRNDNEKVLNFALTLEILEADLYRQALNLASGKPLSTPLAADGSSYTLHVSPGTLSGRDATDGFQYLKQFTFVEAAHRDFLKTALDSLGAPKVTRNPGGYTFGGPVTSTLSGILNAILPLEETGVRAYLGAAVYLTDFNLATTATAIYSTEARHSASIEYLVRADRDPGPNPADVNGSMRVQLNGSPVTYPHPNTFEYFLTPQQVNTAIQPLLVK